MTYEEACDHLDLPLLSTRRVDICQKFFDAMKRDDHKLHDMLPEKRAHVYKLRDSKEYPLPKCKTNRYKNSFVPWCLYNLQ